MMEKGWTKYDVLKQWRDINKDKSKRRVKME